MLKCKRCEHEWKPRMERRPSECPNCKSRYWDTVKERVTPKQRVQTQYMFSRCILRLLANAYQARGSLKHWPQDTPYPFTQSSLKLVKGTKAVVEGLLSDVRTMVAANKKMGKGKVA